MRLPTLPALSLALALVATPAGIACLAAAPSRGAVQLPTLYERIAARMAKDPGLAKRLSVPAPELREAQWLVGAWDVEAHVFATRTSPERRSHGTSVVDYALGASWYRIVDTYADASDMGLLGFDAVSRRWVAVSIDTVGNAATTHARGSFDKGLVFSGPPQAIMGEDVVLRQTIARRGDREYHVLNEERLADGHWVALDEYTYRKRGG